MTPLIPQATATPTRKVTAGAIGSGAIGAPLSVICVYLLTAAGIELPPEVQVAIGSLISTAVGFASAYMAQERVA